MIEWSPAVFFDKDWDHLFDSLLDDVVRFEKLINAEDCGAWRRSYCRSIFSLIDALASQLNRETLFWNYPTLLGDDEIKELQGRTGILKKIFSALDLYTNTSGADTPLKKGSQEWLAIQDAVRIRNRVTHPEISADIEVTDDDLYKLKLTKEIFLSLVRICIENSAAALLKQAEILAKAKL